MKRKDNFNWHYLAAAVLMKTTIAASRLASRRRYQVTSSPWKKAILLGMEIETTERKTLQQRIKGMSKSHLSLPHMMQKMFEVEGECQCFIFLQIHKTAKCEILK